MSTHKPTTEKKEGSMRTHQPTTEKKNLTYESVHEDWPWVWGIRDPEYLDWKLGLSDDEVQAQALRQLDLPVPITDNVYLGNAASVECISRLKACGITAVLNMAGPFAMRQETIKAYDNHGIQYKRIDAEDDENYNLLQNDWDEAFQFIRSSTENGKGKCVVHCRAGINRSVLVVSAYYMMTTQKTVLETVKHVRGQRGNVALWNEGFQQQLVAMARMNNLLGAAPGTDGSIIKQLPPPAEWLWIV